MVVLNKLREQYNISYALKGAAFAKKIHCLVARIVSFDTVGLHLLTFCTLEPYPPKDIALYFSHVISH